MNAVHYRLMKKLPFLLSSLFCSSSRRSSKIIFQELKLNHNTASVFVRVILPWISGHFLVWKTTAETQEANLQMMMMKFTVRFITPSLWGSLFLCVGRELAWYYTCGDQHSLMGTKFPSPRV